MKQKFRKKPVVIEAIQLTKETASQCAIFVNGHPTHIQDAMPHNSIDAIDTWDNYVNRIITDQSMKIGTLEGEIKASFGDYIIKGVEGEFYPCKPDIFKKTYDLVEN